MLSDQIGGQIAAGFVLVAFVEAPHHGAISAKQNHMSGYFATPAVKQKA
jgi:hypothetical protein